LVNSIDPLDFELSMQLFYPFVTHFPSPQDTRKQPTCSSLFMHLMDGVYEAFGLQKGCSKPYLNH